VTLVFIRPVTNFAEPVEEDRTAERILLLAFIETYVTAPTELGVLQPIKRKESTFQLAEFSKCVCEAVLPGLGRQLAQDHRGSDRSRFD
jgi:hypothetical protein